MNDDQTPLWKLVEEAAVRFSLSPLEEHFLMMNWAEIGQDTGAPH